MTVTCIRLQEHRPQQAPPAPAGSARSRADGVAKDSSERTSVPDRGIQRDHVAQVRPRGAPARPTPRLDARSSC